MVTLLQQQQAHKVTKDKTMTQPNYVVATNCTCDNDLMIELGIVECCHACTKARQVKVVGK